MRGEKIVKAGIQMNNFISFFSRKFVEYVVFDPRSQDFLKWSENTYTPDEHFWASLNALKFNPHLNTPGGNLGDCFLQLLNDLLQFFCCLVPWFLSKELRIVLGPKKSSSLIKLDCLALLGQFSVQNLSNLGVYF